MKLLYEDSLILISSGVFTSRDKASAFALSFPALCSVLNSYSYKSIIQRIIFLDLVDEDNTYDRALLSV